MDYVFEYSIKYSITYLILRYVTKNMNTGKKSFAYFQKKIHNVVILT